METASDKDAVEIADMTANDKEYHQNLKQQVLRALTRFARSSTTGKMH